MRKLERHSVEEAVRTTKNLKQKFDNYESKRGSVYYSDNDDFLDSPKFTKEEIRSVQEAINNQDISLCLDVLDKLKDVLDAAEAKNKEIVKVEEKIEDAWKKYLAACKAIGDPNITGSDDHGNWKSNIEESSNPIFYRGQVSDDAVKNIEDLYNFIVDAFK